MTLKCPHCCPLPCFSSEFRTIRRIGRFWRKSDGRWISRFLCLLCERGFSQSTTHPCYRQNKRHKNLIVRRLLCAGVSQREASRVTGLNRKTIVRKLLYWERLSEIELERSNQENPNTLEVQFDELETFEHTKCKPLSVPLMVDAKTRRVIGFEVCKMPAKGKLAAMARKKYGFRVDERAKARSSLFLRVKKHLSDNVMIRSDSNPHDPKTIQKHFPKARHQTIQGKRGAITGFGELKKTQFDPLFSLNHTCAMMRAHINRLMRKTWCTTKDPIMLKKHLEIYVCYHNQYYLK